MYRRFFRPLLFNLDPERAHDLTILLLNVAGHIAPIRALMKNYFNAHSHFTNTKTTTIFNTKFNNPIGLAAGFDKNAMALRGLAALGFGHVEVGTVTPYPQTGNPKPRVFRIPEENAIINRMGFPGKGVDFVTRQLITTRQACSPVIIGVNIGKNKNTHNDEAANDYLLLLEKFSPLADFLTVNVSSPNTVGLRRLQARDQLEGLLNQLAQKRSSLPIQKPILVKLAPDLSDDELDDSLAAIVTSEIDGVVATNTTIDRAKLRSPLSQESGGLSGGPLNIRSLRFVKTIYSRTGGKLPIVGVGGIMSPDNAKAMLDAGASLIQLYTGLIYAGPSLVKNILEKI